MASIPRKPVRARFASVLLDGARENVAALSFGEPIENGGRAFALERTPIEASFTGQDEIGRGKLLVELEPLRNERETRDIPGIREGCPESETDASGRAATRLAPAGLEAVRGMRARDSAILPMSRSNRS